MLVVLVETLLQSVDTFIVFVQAFMPAAEFAISRGNLV